MTVSVLLTFFILCLIAQNSALLFHGDSIPRQTTTLRPLGTDASLSLLVKNVLNLEGRVKSQEQEIERLKNQDVPKDNFTNVILDQLMSEYIELKLGLKMIEKQFEQNNNLAGLHTLKTRQDNMAQSIRYFSLSLRDNDIQFMDLNATIHRKLYHLKVTLENELQYMRSEIQNYAYILSRVYQYESRLKTAIVHIKSEIQTMQKYRTVIDYVSKRFEALRSKYTSFVAYPFCPMHILYLKMRVYIIGTNYSDRGRTKVF